MLTCKSPCCPAGQEQAIQGAGGISDSSSGTHWQELLASPEIESFGGRAKSASDAGVLRRKGHLKEQDLFIEFLLHMHTTHTSEEVS